MRCGVVRLGVVWCGVWCGVVCCEVRWCGVVWYGVWCGVVRCDVVCCGLVWCDVVGGGVRWFGVVWCAKLNPRTPLNPAFLAHTLIEHPHSRTHFSGHRRTVRSVLGFSFACGLRPHAKLNPRTPLTPAFLAHNPNLRGAVP